MGPSPACYSSGHRQASTPLQPLKGLPLRLAYRQASLAHRGSPTIKGKPAIAGYLRSSPLASALKGYRPARTSTVTKYPYYTIVRSPSIHLLTDSFFIAQNQRHKKKPVQGFRNSCKGISYFINSSKLQRSIDMISQPGCALPNISFITSVLLNFGKLKLNIGSLKKSVGYSAVRLFINDFISVHIDFSFQ